MFQPGAFQPDALQVGADQGVQAGFQSLALLGLPGGMGANVASGAYTLTAAVGTFTLSGQAASTNYGRLLTAAQGSFSLSGQANILKYGHVLTAAQGSFTLSGQVAGLVPVRSLTAAHGTFALSGQAAGLTRSRLLTADYGSFALTGQAAGTFYGRALAAAYGTFALSGQDAALTRPGVFTLPAEYGSFVLSGQDAGLSYTPIAVTPTTPQVGHVSVRGRGRTRVWVEIRNGQVYEVSSEQEAKKVVRAIKRKAVRQAAQAARNDSPPPEAPEVTVRGEVELLPDLRREIADIQVDMARVYERIALDRLRQQEEDDEEAVIALFM